ncbi:MAG: nucleotide sugar dehydrogenase [Ignavibacteria bacterium]|nr:nucleotide sugar dehydrogenase [Ignavibacteria bacterium]MDH7527471.1 nucleotide sugar dehydrogenase [Ignavibacteria bacterium]
MMNNFKDLLLNKIKNRTAKVGIIGMGYVGLPLALEFAEENFNVMGFDIDENKIPLLNKGESYIRHIPSPRIKKQVDKGNFNATIDFSKLQEMDAIIICVPTPLNKYREPDVSYIKNSAEIISKYFKPGKLVVLESSTYPGTTEEIIKPYLDNPINPEIEEELTCGEDYFLAFSPEREDPNNPNFNTKTIPKVVGGVTENCLNVAKSLYDQVIVKTVPVSSTRVAEATKLLENIYRSVNIALVNELKMVFDKMGIDIWEVIEAAKTKPFGFQAFYPGPGLGGHCIPIDPFYLTWKAREYEASTRFIELAGEINTMQPYFVVQKIAEALNNFEKTIKGSKILLLGMAYKKNVDDMRESPSLKLFELLEERGAIVDYSDPYIPQLPETRKYKFKKQSIDLNPENIQNYDVVVIATDHDDFNYDLIYQYSKIIVDTRNALKINGLVNGKVFKA